MQTFARAEGGGSSSGPMGRRQAWPTSAARTAWKSRRMLATLLNDLGDKEAALEAWEALDAESGGDVEALRNIIALAMKEDDSDRAIGALERLRALEADPEEIARIDETMRRLSNR